LYSDEFITTTRYGGNNILRISISEAKSAGDEPAHEKSAGVHKNGNNATTENQ
jgi:hypothetical protein